MVMGRPVFLENYQSNTGDDILFAEHMLNTFYTRRSHTTGQIDDADLLMPAAVHSQLAQALATGERLQDM